MNRLYGIYEKAMPVSLTMIKKLTAAKKAGYDYMELCFDENKENLKKLDIPKSKIKEIKTLAEDVCIGLHSICLSAHRKYSLGSMDNATAQYGLDLSNKTFDFACELGLKVILIAGYDVFYEESTPATRAKFLANLKVMADRARTQGLILGLENVDAAISCDIESCLRILKAVNAPNLGLYLDFGNMNALGIDYLKEIPKAAGFIEAVHIKDTKQDVYKHVPMGQGTVDFAAVSKLFKELHCDAPCVIEMWNQNNKDFMPRITNALQFAKEQFDYKD